MATREMNMDQSWVADVLREDNLELAETKHAKTHGKRQLTAGVRFVLWLLRGYVLLMMLIIAVQLWIGTR